MNNLLMQLEFGLKICEEDLINCENEDGRLIIIKMIDDFKNKISECNSSARNF